MPQDQLPLPGLDVADLPTEPADENPPAVHCHNCDCVVDEHDGIEHDGHTHCPDCVYHCGDCEETTTDPDTLRECRTHSGYRHSATQMLCSDCRWECDDCNESFANRVEGSHNAAGQRICDSCSDNYTTCDDCDEIISTDDSRYHEETERTYCESCYPRESSVLHEYDYKPRPEFYRGEGEKNHRDTMYLGIELEIDKGASRDRCDDIRTVGLDEGAFYCKRDGSLDDGFEIVSHPGTFAFWQKYNWGFTGKLKGMGYRSYDTTTCGMHVHVSRAALSGLAIFKLLEFGKRNQDFMIRISRRRKAMLDRWAGIDGSSVREIVRKVKNGNDHDSRYTAINLENDKTVEFRIFRGTLDTSAIHRNLAFVVALCHYVKGAPLHKLTAADFAAWLGVNGKKYLGASASPLISWVRNTISGRAYAGDSDSQSQVA